MKCASRLGEDAEDEEEICYFIILPPRSGARFADFLFKETPKI